jgi:hypothetical protein
MVVDNDGGNDKLAGGSGVVRIATTAGNNKRQAWPPTDHIEKLLEEAYTNHAYLVKHKIKGYDMMKNFMASGSLTRGMEQYKVPDEADMTPFPGEDTITTVCDAHPPPPGWGCAMCLT